MDFLIVLLLSLAVSPASLQSPPILAGINGKIKDINEINKDLNLHEGDIMMDTPITRSAILGDQYRWNGYIPYVLNNTLSLNDKGVILRAFEQLRLKGCIDLKPWKAEKDYVSVESLTGCWSYIGKNGGKQKLSIGDGCGYIGIVEHEFLHCLGFFHEQSRYDRDNYVTINYQYILPGMSSNFDKVSEQQSTLQGTPYNYMSLMHYGQNDFSNGSGPTIVTKDASFQDVIGQRYDLSHLDAFELYNLYKCNETISFLDRCSFEGNTCQMATCSSANADNWHIMSNVSGGPFSDHTNLPPLDNVALYMNNYSSEPSSFMHFSTKTGQTGDSARLESREMTPHRACNVQCLEFFYYHSGNETDQLNIWIREYQSVYDTTGTLRLMDQIKEPPTDHWHYRLVPLDASKTFQVGFEARKGAGYSSGGFSVDDINLSESECSHNIWQINNFMETWNQSQTYLFSPLYYSPEGYRYQVFLFPSQDFFGLYVRLVSGVYDNSLQWPCPWRQVTFMVLDQTPDIRNRASKQQSLTTDPNLLYGGKPVWGRPSEVGSQELINNELVYANIGWGYLEFMDKARIGDREFVKGGDLFILTSMQDISSLQQNDILPCPRVPLKNFNVSLVAQIEPCVARERVTTTPPTTSKAKPPTTSKTTPPTTSETTLPDATTPLDSTTPPGATTPPETFPPRECLDIFCSGVNIVPPSVALLLALVLLVVN